MTAGRGGSQGGPPVLEVVRDANEAALAAGRQMPFSPPQIIRGVNFDDLARAHPQCWTCTLHLREPKPPEPEPEEGEEKKPKPKPRRSPAPKRTQGQTGALVPLPGARDVQRGMHEMWFGSYSYRAIAQMVADAAKDLGWRPKADTISFDSVAAHFANHMPIQMRMARRLTEAAARDQGVDHLTDSLATLDAVIDKAMNAVDIYANTDLEITSPVEMIAVSRWARQEKERIMAGRNRQAQQVSMASLLMELRKITPPQYWDQLVDRFWAQRDGVPVGEWTQAQELPAGPEYSDEPEPYVETERDIAIAKLVVTIEKRKERSGLVNVAGTKKRAREEED